MTNSQPTLSIIVPFDGKNHDYLESLFQTLSRQQFTDYELIIVAVATSEIDREKAAHPAVKWLDGGTSNVPEARNLGLAQATGDYVLFMDADDYLLDGALSRVAAVAQSQTPDMLSMNRVASYENLSSFLTEQNVSPYHDEIPKNGKPVKESQKRSLSFGEHDVENLLKANGSEQSLPHMAELNDLLHHKFTIETDENRFDAINRRIRVSGVWFKRAFLEAHQIQFDGTQERHSDIGFSLKALKMTERFYQMNAPEYTKFRHNDPVNNPSQSQLDLDGDWYWRIRAYTTVLAHSNNAELRDALSTYALDRIVNPFYRYFGLQEIADDVRQKTFKQLQDFMKVVVSTAVLTLSNHDQKALHQVAAGNFAAALKTIQKQQNRLRVKKAFKKGGRALRRLFYENWFSKLSLKKTTIMYETFLGRNYSDSPKYIYEYIEKHYPGQFKHVWVMAEGVDAPQAAFRHTKVITRFGWKYVWYLARAKYIVINVRQPRWYIHREGQTLLSTWHGTPLKRLVFDMENVAGATPLYKQIFFEQDSKWDYLVVPNQYSADIFEHAFMYPQDKMLMTGYPRNDVLSSPTIEADARRIKERLGIPQDKKVILYAPTWRDDEYFGVGQYKFNLKLQIDKMREAFGDEYVLVLRTHYFISNNLDTTGFGDFVFDESNYNDIADLYVISDVLITDYSSVFFDYAVLRRPILFYAYDFEKYQGVLRGFYIDMNTELPGPILKTTDEVVDAMKHLPQIEQDYAAKYDEFHERFNAWEDGHATERVVNAVFKDLPQEK